MTPERNGAGPAPPPNHHRRKRLHWFAAFGILLLVLALVFMSLTQDEALASHDDLRPVELDAIPDGDNAWVLMNLAGEQVVQATQVEIWNLADWAATTPAGRSSQKFTWDDIEKCLQKNQSALATLERAALCQRYRPPIPRTIADQVNTVSLTSTRAMHGLLRVRARWHLHHGRVDGALRDIHRSLRLAWFAHDSAVSTIDAMVAGVMAWDPVEDLKLISARDDVDPARLRAILADAIPRSRPGRGIARALRCEFDLHRRTVLEYATQEDLPRYLPRRMTYKRNRTLNLTADLYRAAIDHARQDLPARAFQPDLPDAPLINSYGDYLLEIIGSLLESTLETHVRWRSDLEGLQMTLAERIYELENGRPPPNPETLVPGILPELP